MGDMIEPAFHRAMTAAGLKLSKALKDVTLVTAKDEMVARALITAYLDDPDVILAAADGLDILADHNTAMAVGILKAIGAKGVE